MKFIKASWTNMHPSIGYEEISDIGHRMGKDILATAQDLCLQIENEDIIIIRRP